MSVIGLLLILPCLCLLAAIFLPTRLANTNARIVRSVVTALAGIQLIGAAALFAFRALPAAGEQVSHTPILAGLSGGLSFSLHLDMVASLMLLLVSFIGWIICRYSIRYLDGDPNQGRHFRWTAFTIGAVSLLVVSGNLVLFFGAWVMTSFGLHQLLLHFPDRPAAQRAAWTKFAISRIGDCFLLAAIALVYRQFGTFQFDEIFAAISSGTAGSVTAISWCLIIGALTKSAQFPLHSWLPETMETPTPVSALMHAGIVNAGGYLVIRLSPIIVEAPQALAFLAVIGLVTVCFAGIVMLTQTSIKKTLAFSTVAQMGFMMLQCGLGAFSAALLHIIAHSLYKAHAFLSSGNVLAEAARTNSSAAVQERNPMKLQHLLAHMACVLASLLAVGYLFGISLSDKAGGVALGVVFFFVLTAWIWDIARMSDTKLVFSGYAAMALLALLYAAGFYSVDYLVAANVATATAGVSAVLVSIVVATAFLGIFILQWLISSERGRLLLQPAYVHASNGFYVDAAVRRLWSAMPAFKL